MFALDLMIGAARVCHTWAMRRAASGNSRNGVSSKTILTDDGEVEIAVPRDRAGSFEPQLIAKGADALHRFDDKILSLYARGMTVREMQGHLVGTVWYRRLARPDQPGDGCGARRGARMAEPAARLGLSDRVFRRPAGQNPRTCLHRAALPRRIHGSGDCLRREVRSLAAQFG